MNKDKIKEKVIYFLHIIIPLGLLYVLIEYIGMLYGFIIFVIAYVIYVLIKNWKNYIYSMEYIEYKVFGKPLNKKYWKDEKLPKLRFVLKKKETKEDGPGKE